MNFEKQPPVQLDQVSLQILAQTPLHYACYTGDGHLLDTLIGRVLLYNNNDGDASDSCVAALVSEEDSLNGWTPAHWASFYGQLSCLMKLHVKPHLGFDTPTHRSNTSPLHLASQSGSVLCVKWLLQCGASKNKQDFMGETPLHKAAKAGNTDCAAMLIGHGAATELKNHRGLIPSDLAEQSNHVALAQYLKRAAEQAEYGGITKCITSPLPVSDLNSSIPPNNTQMSSHVYKSYPRFPDMSFLAKEQQTTNHSNIFMNGEGIHNTCSSDSCDMDQTDSEMMENTVNVHKFVDEVPQVFGRVKRSYDAIEDDDMQSHKRRCFVPLSQKSREERYGNAYNNNIISSYNAVLAMKVEPMSTTCDKGNFKPVDSKPGSPISPQSSLMEHQASLEAQQGYDSTFMTSISSAFH